MIPNWIIIHHSLTADGQTVSWNAIRKYHVETKHFREIGYNFGLELIGDHYEILIGRMMDEEGAHTIGMNDCSLGICLIGNFDMTDVPRAQLMLLIRLVRCLMDCFEIPKDHVKRHCDYAGYKSCPGDRFPWSEFIGYL